MVIVVPPKVAIAPVAVLVDVPTETPPDCTSVIEILVV